MEQLIKQTLETIARLANSQLVAIFRVLENQSCGVVGVFKQGQVILHSSEIKIKFKDTPFAKIISTRQTQTYPCLFVKKWSLPFPAYKKTNSGFECVCIPLLGGESKPVAGVAAVAKKNGVASERLQMLKMLSPLMASILEEISRERDQIIESVIHDPITNLYTRPYFEIRLQQEMTRVHRHGGIFSILLIDIDHFNKIHSNSGYQEANRVLQEFARILNASTRQEIDIPCRYDSKMFIAMLPNTNVDDACVLAERIRQRCGRCAFSTRLGVPLKFTVSIGVAQNVNIAYNEFDDGLDIPTPAIGLSKEELIQRAEMMLEVAKQAGGNQVMVWW